MPHSSDNPLPCSQAYSGQLCLPEDSPLMSGDFVFGAATAAFQIEGAADQRLPCIWDTFCSVPGNIRDGSNGNVACDHYHRLEQDLDILAEMGVDAYRFSISWPRVMDEQGQLRETGVAFYRQLLAGLKKRNIKAFVTLYHWDLPQHLEDKGGWLNRETAYHFAHYVDAITQALGPDVYSYATLNEPFCSAYLGYEIGIHAPGKKGRNQGKKAAHHLLLAHGLAMQILRKHCPDSLNGIVLNFSPCHSASDSDEDRQAAQRADAHFNQWYIQPLMEGCYPDLIDSLPADERPEIVPGDMAIIAQPLDFLGINYYTRETYRAAPDGEFERVEEKILPLTQMGWEIYPKGLTEILLAMHQRYRLPPVYITENGAAMDDRLVDGKVDDQDRLAYYQSHLLAVHDACLQGVQVKGYFAWSLLDNFEWAEGYLKRFGLVYVDYETQARTVKTSGLAYGQMLKHRKRA